MHVGHPGNIDIDFTVTRKRSVGELLRYLPNHAPERTYFESDPAFRTAFPSGDFNCWGVPSRAAPAFQATRPGDLVFFIPWIGIHGGGVHQVAVVKAICQVSALSASRILWPETPHDRLYPLLFFFQTEIGMRPWYQFLQDMGYNERWDPRGWYRRIADERFATWDGPAGYLEFLRSKCGFKPL